MSGGGCDGACCWAWELDLRRVFFLGATGGCSVSWPRSWVRPGMEVLERPEEESMLATSRGLTFCRLASSRPVSSRELGLVAVPLELDADELEEDGPREIFGLGSFGGVAPAVTVNGTRSNGFLRELEEAGC